MSSSFGPFLRSVREKLGKTMKQVADLLEVSTVYISDIERGKRNPPSEDKIKKSILSDVTGWLFEKSG